MAALLFPRWPGRGRSGGGENLKCLNAVGGKVGQSYRIIGTWSVGSDVSVVQCKISGGCFYSTFCYCFYL